MTRTKRLNLAILCAAAALCWAPSAFAQTPSIAFKPGLWTVPDYPEQGNPQGYKGLLPLRHKPG